VKADRDEPPRKTTSRVRGTTRRVELAARDLRCRLTPAEASLWEALQQRQLRGLRFRRQHPVGPFVVDFFCPAVKLVVQVDGPIHDEQVDQDEYRSQHLASYGYRVIRFLNDQVLNDLQSVLAAIATAAECRVDDPHEP